MAKKTVETKPNAQAVFAKIITEFRDNSRAEIKRWRNALTVASAVDNPRVYVLQDLFENLEADGHLISQIGLRKVSTMGAKFAVIDKRTGKKDEEKTELLNSEWFFDLMGHILDTPIKGYTLLEISDFAKPEFKLIPRRNVCARDKIVLLEASADKGVPYADLIGQTLIEVGQPSDLGLLAKLCGQLIWKRNAQQSWAEFSEKFGMPLISATTNKTSTAEINRVEKMLAALGEAAQAVLPEGTTLDIKQFAGTDSFNVYLKQIEFINSELGKPITGGTMISDNGSSRSQSEVHERNLDDKIAMFDKMLVQFTVNGRLFPLLANWGFPFNPDTDKFIFEDSWNIDLDKYWTIIKGMMDEGYEVDQEWLSKTFNIPIIGKTEKTPAPPLPQAKPTASFSSNFM